ncbi:hypothetical protein FWF89_03135 [Candidatus Saccharibacteria bacterium]|nr:hypothetical protein [Candidatus Saccharibacteria bacterium]
MIKVFCGEDRMGAQREVDRVLGEDYEVIEGETLLLEDLPSLFLGTSLFGEVRRILVKDLGENTACWEALPKYLESSHTIIIWESKLDKRTATYKSLQKQKVEMKEFVLAEAPEKKLVFDVLDVAWRGDGKRAVGLIEQIEITSDPFMFVGLMVSQVMRKLESGDKKAGRAVKLLAACDMKMKSTSIKQWTLVKATMVEIAAIK